MIMTQHGGTSSARGPVRGQQGRGIKLETACAIGRHVCRRLRDHDHPGLPEEQSAYLLHGISISVIEDLIDYSP